MKAAAATRSIHVLEIPTSGTPLILPSAVVAEIVNIGSIVPAPQMPSWCVGVTGWRQHGVSVLSFEAMTGQVVTEPGSRGKLVVLFPFPGQPQHQFFAFVSTAEPQPHMLTDKDSVPVEPPVQSQFIASAMNIQGTTGVIPNFNTLRNVIYPPSAG